MLTKWSIPPRALNGFAQSLQRPVTTTMKFPTVRAMWGTADIEEARVGKDSLVREHFEAGSRGWEDPDNQR